MLNFRILEIKRRFIYLQRNERKQEEKEYRLYFKDYEL